MKMPMEWHRQCLENMISNLSTEEDRVNRAVRDLNRSRIEVATYREQIIEAERRGMDGFDAERLLKKRKQ